MIATIPCNKELQVGANSNKIRKADYEVVEISHAEGMALIRQHHYAQGGSRTCVYMHGLRRKADGAIVGACMWLPPTRVAAESVDRENWQRVLSLTRLVVLPDVPGNGASFLMAGSIRRIRREGKWKSLVTYADTFMGHSGAIYRATNWLYVGETRPTPRWEDADGRQVAPKSTVNRTKAEMEALGYRKVGSFKKHKFVMYLDGGRSTW
jgi:hypothetical protein